MAKTVYFPPHFETVDAYAEALERELAGYQTRQAELEAMGLDESEGPMIDAVTGQKAVRDELARIGKGEPAKRKPGRPKKVVEEPEEE